MKTIKSALLSEEFSSRFKNSKNIFNLGKKDKKLFLSKSTMKIERNNLSDRNSLSRNNNLFLQASKIYLKQLEELNLFLNEEINIPKTERLYPTEIPNIKTINTESSSKKHKYRIKTCENKRRKDSNFIKSKTSSSYKIKDRNSKGIISKERNKNGLQTYVNLSFLLGKKKIENVKKVEPLKYEVEPMNVRSDYNKLIVKKSFLNFKKSQESIFAHKVRSHFMIDNNEKIKKQAFKQKKIFRKNLLHYEKIKKIEEEAKDVIDINFIEFSDAKKKLKKYIYSVNEKNFNEDKNYILFKSYENRINYIYDMCHIPTFKNHLLKYNNKIDYEINYINELDCPNFIDYNSWNYLNIKKAKIQTFIDKSNKEKKEESISKNGNDNGIKYSKSIDNKIFDYINKKDEEEKKDKENIKTDNKFLRKELQLTKEVEDYFVLKIIYKNNSYFASDKLKEVVYNKFY